MSVTPTVTMKNILHHRAYAVKLWLLVGLCHAVLTHKILAQPPHTTHAASWADSMMQQMSLEDKIAQLIMWQSEDSLQMKQILAEYKVGGVLTDWSRLSSTYVATLEKIYVHKEGKKSNLPPFAKGGKITHGITTHLEGITDCQHMHMLSSIKETKARTMWIQQQVRTWKACDVSWVVFPKICANITHTDWKDRYKHLLLAQDIEWHEHDEKTDYEEREKKMNRLNSAYKAYMPYIKSIQKGHYILTPHIESTHAKLWEYAVSSEKHQKIIEKACHKLLQKKHKYLIHQHTQAAVTPAPTNEKLTQLTSQANTYAYFQKSLIVAKNNEKIVPLLALSPRLVLLSIGALENIFYESIAHYQQVSHYTLEEVMAKASCQQDLFQLGDTLIVAWQGEKFHLSAEEEGVLQQLCKKKQVIIAFFDTHQAYAQQLKNYSFMKNTQALLVHPSSHAHAQQHMVNALFGGASAQGVWPYAKKTALQKKKANSHGARRLVYAPPEVLGMSATLLHTKIDEIVTEGLAQKAFPGCQILAAKGGKIFFHKTYGYHTYQNRRQVKPSDLYDLASITKASAPILALMRLYEEEELDIESSMGEHFPFLQGSDKENISCKQALSHQAGLYPFLPFYRDIIIGEDSLNCTLFMPNTCSYNYSKEYSLPIGGDGIFLHKNYSPNLYQAIAASPLQEKAFSYSDLSYYLWPSVIEKKTNTPYVEYLEKEFYAPLGANTLTYHPIKKYALSSIVPTENDDYFRGGLLHGYVHDEGAALMGGASGHAGLFGNALDVAKLWQMYLNEGTYGGKEYFLPATLATFTQAHYADKGNRKGIGFDKPPLIYEEGKSPVAAAASAKSFGHTGYTGTLVWVDPANELLFVFLSNRVHPTRDNTTIYELDLRPRIHQTLYDALQHAHDFSGTDK